MLRDDVNGLFSRSARGALRSPALWEQSEHGRPCGPHQQRPAGRLPASRAALSARGLSPVTPLLLICGDGDGDGGDGAGDGGRFRARCALRPRPRRGVPLSPGSSLSAGRARAPPAGPRGGRQGALPRAGANGRRAPPIGPIGADGPQLPAPSGTRLVREACEEEEKEEGAGLGAHGRCLRRKGGF